MSNQIEIKRFTHSELPERLSESSLQSDKLSSIRIAAAADLHIGHNHYPENFLGSVNENADILIIAGDMTDFGREAEWQEFVSLIKSVTIPVYIVFGNHDNITDGFSKIKEQLLSLENVTLLDGDFASLKVGNIKIGIAGGKGSEGGFGGDLKEELDERAAHEIVAKEYQEVAHLKPAFQELSSAELDLRIAVLHYVPFEEGVKDEPSLVSWLHGSTKYGEMISNSGAQLALHGHFHSGIKGVIVSKEGVAFSNIALPVNDEEISFFEVTVDSIIRPK